MLGFISIFTGTAAALGTLAATPQRLSTMDIWHINNKHWTKLMLWRRADGTFRVAADGEYNALLVNGDYTIISNKYESVLSCLSDQVAIKPIKIVDMQFLTENENYLELIVKNKITPENINSLDSMGSKIWTFDKNIFVSTELKKNLQMIDANDFNFNLGFSLFG